MLRCFSQRNGAKVRFICDERCFAIAIVANVFIVGLALRFEEIRCRLHSAGIRPANNMK